MSSFAPILRSNALGPPLSDPLDRLPQPDIIHVRPRAAPSMAGTMAHRCARGFDGVVLQKMRFQTKTNHDINVPLLELLGAVGAAVGSARQPCIGAEACGRGGRRRTRECELGTMFVLSNLLCLKRNIIE